MRRAAELRVRRALVSALFLGGAAFPLAGPLAAACASSGSAALVVDTGEASYTYCVSLPARSVSGIELIQLAGDQHGLQYRLGYGGGAVCQLQNVGPDGDDCFADYPDFWGYWRGDGSGGWNWSDSGAGSTTVESGDVEGWSWGSGQDGASHQQPPATAYSSVCAASAPPRDEEEPTKDEKKKRRSGPSGSSGSSGGGDNGKDTAGATSSVAAPAPAGKNERTAASEKPKRDQKRKSRRKSTRDKDSRSIVTSPSPVAEAEEPAAPVAAPTNGQQQPGAPAAGLAALGVAALLGGAGFIFRGRRGKPGT